MWKYSEKVEKCWNLGKNVQKGNNINKQCLEIIFMNTVYKNLINESKMLGIIKILLNNIYIYISHVQY